MKQALIDNGRVLWELVQFAVATRRFLFALLIVASMVATFIVVVVKVTAPVVIYPLI